MEKSLKFLVITILILSFISSFSLISLLTIKPIQELEYIQTERTNVSFSDVQMGIPAVDDQGNGVITTLIVELKPGRGGVLVDINQLLFWVDTQNSIRIAQRVAQEYTNLNLSDVDLTYAIETEASVIGGPSAGAAITIATIAILENKTLNPNVMITGTVDTDGNIGQVGEVVAKAKAAKDAGATLFLVPSGQAVEISYTPVQTCRRIGPVTWCETEYKEEEVNVSRDADIEVKEVSNIEEALIYFLA